MKILVTTDAGSLGAKIVLKLAQTTAHDIVSISTEHGHQETIDYSAYNVIQHQCDLSDLLGLIQLTAGVDLIIHAAEFRSSVKTDKHRLFEINQQGTAHIVDCCLANGVGQLLYISHVSALGADRGRPLHEDDIWMDKPLKSLYGQSKYLGEQEIWRGQAEGLSVNIIAHSTIVSTSLRDLGSAKELTTGVVSEHDIVDMVKAMIDRGLDGEKYICSAHSITHAQLHDALFSQSDGSKSTMSIAAFWRRRLPFLFGQPMTNDGAYLLQPHRNIDYDNHKSINQLGFTYRSVEETLDIR